jgi:hypothetical protein
MFFTKLGKIIAWLVFVISSVRVTIAVGVATGTSTMADNAAASARYLGTSSSGEAINQILIVLLASIALGILCEISSGVRGWTVEDQ